MDPRRLLIASSAAVYLGGCALVRAGSPPPPARPALGDAPPPQRLALKAVSVAPAAAPEPPGSMASAGSAAPRTFAVMAPIANPIGGGGSAPVTSEKPGWAPGPMAIAAANAAAREPSRSRAFLGAVQVFAYDPGRVYDVWTAPLRVTTLTLSPGETLIAKAAGDTVRWQIGETHSGDGRDQRAHLMIKPLERGLETNMVITTNRRVYLLQLHSGGTSTFNAAVAWDLGAWLDPTPIEPRPQAEIALAAPAAPALDGLFRIVVKGRRPVWTPIAVLTDGVRTYLSFPPELVTREAPALFAVAADGAPQLVNYRQRGGLWVVDQVLERAELRLGRAGPIVRIERTADPS